MAVAEAHPSVEELTAFTLGTLDDETQAFIEDHVATCTSCQERAATAPGDSFVELVRSLRAGTTQEADTSVGPEAQVHTPVPLSAVAATDAIAPAVAPSATAASHRAAVPDAVPPELARHERYRVVRLLRAGGMGAVYEAEHRVMQKRVALKVIHPAYLARADALERFRREVRAAARLSHRYIVTTHDAEDAGETHFLVMEYVEGIDLGRLVRERGRLAVDRACDYVRQAALGLQYAFEQGMVHRDLKPHNLMLTPEEDVKILDFGLARFASEAGSAAGLTDTGLVLGTVDYIAPEQADHARQADIRSDIYSLGCTLYHLLAGQPPFPTGTPVQKVMAHCEKKPQPLTELRDDLPEGLMPVLERMMAKNPRHRFQTPAEVAVALERFTTEAAPARNGKRRPRVTKTDHSQTLVPQKPPAYDRRRRRIVALAAALFFVVTGLLGGAVYRIATDKGELVITTESDDVKVVITQGGKVVDVIDTKTDKQIRLSLRSGVYELELKGAPEGLKLNIDKATLTRGQETLAKIEKIGKTRVGEIRRFGAEGYNARRVALSLDGKRLLTGGFDGLDGSARYWDIATGKEIYRLPSKRVQVDAVAISPDGTKLLSCGGDRLIHVYDAATGNEVKQLTGHTGEIYGVAISPDGRMVASSGHDCQLRLWNLDTGELIASPGSAGGGNGAAFSPDGKLIATWSQDHLVRLWDVKTLKEIRRLEGHKEWVVAAAFSGDGSHLLTGTWPSDGNGPPVARPSDLKLWEVKTGKPLLTIDVTPRNVHGLAISPDGRRALSCGTAGLVELWDLESGKQIIAFKGHVGPVHDVAFLPDGRTALSAGSDNTIRLWRLPDPSPTEKVGEIRRFVGHQGAVFTATFSPDGTNCLTASGDRTIKLWSVGTGKELQCFQGHEQPVYCAAFTPDGKKIVSGSPDATMRLWDVESGKELKHMRHGAAVWWVCVSPDGESAVSVGQDKIMRLWNLKTGEEQKRFEGHGDGGVRVAVFAPDGKHLLSGGWDGTMRLWDVKTGKELQRYGSPNRAVHCVAFSPDGRWALSCDKDAGPDVLLWDLESAKPIRRFAGHTASAHSVAFSADGRRALSGGYDHTLRLWDVETGRELHCFTARQIWGVAFSPDGKYAVSGGDDVRLWRLPDTSPAKEKP